MSLTDREHTNLLLAIHHQLHWIRRGLALLLLLGSAFIVVFSLDRYPEMVTRPGWATWIRVALFWVVLFVVIPIAIGIMAMSSRVIGEVWAPDEGR
jgi:hypothetical protein